MDPPKHPPSRPRDRLAIACVAAIAMAWAIVAWAASLGNSSTFDEPLHTAASIAAVHGELGVNPEHPPLWKYVAGLPHAGEAWLDLSPPTRLKLRGEPAHEWPWALGEMYYRSRGSGEDGEAEVRASRVAMLSFGVALVACAAGLAWRVGGRGAGLLAAALLALDPLLIGHGPIVTNDVAVSLVLLATLWVGAELRAGANWRWAVLLGALIGASACAKFTGVLALPLGLGLVLLRRKPRFPVAGIAFLTAHVAIWGLYGFRFGPGPDDGAIDIGACVNQAMAMVQAKTGQTELTAPLKVLLFAERNRLLPQPMLAGMTLSYGVTRGGMNFAAGRLSPTGWWWYFPFALAVKAPLGLLAAWASAGVLALRARLARKGAAEPAATPSRPALPPLAICAAAMLAASMASPLNIGLRHLLPVVAIGSTLAAVALARLAPKGWRWALVALIAIETAGGFPQYVPFFNVVGRAVGPEHLLADSNLDWGQDLKRLADWRRAHPEGTLHLAYWGTADPRAYGLEFRPLPRQQRELRYAAPTEPGYYAVSESFLQGLRPEVAQYYGAFDGKPSTWVGRSIRVFQIP